MTRSALALVAVLATSTGVLAQSPDIDTPLLNKRPVVPDSDARAKMMKPEDIAQCVIFCVQLPPRVIVEELLVRPR